MNYTDTKEVNYYLRVKTNCYTGNFEREMCAFMTGHVGECEVGEELVEEEIAERFEGSISSKADEYGCWRPVELDDEDSNNFLISLKKILSQEDIKFLEKRAQAFEATRPYKYLDKNFQFLGLEQIEETITTSRKVL